VILVLVIVYVPEVIRGDSGDGENTQTIEGIRVDKHNVWTTKCGCNENPKCSLSPCGDNEYCDNTGNQLSDNDFECRQCGMGLYFRKHVVGNVVSISGYREVKSLPFIKETMECVDVGLDSICYKKYKTMYGTERTLQACQHCPIFTIVNPVVMVDLSLWFRGPQDEDLNKKALTDTRCWPSCSMAWSSGNLMVFMTVLSRSAQIHFLLYPTVSICTQAYQAIGKRNSLNNSVAGFSDLNVDAWLNSECADLTTEIPVSVWTCRDPCLRNHAVDDTVVAHNTEPH
jgi:hypothetical protein